MKPLVVTPSVALTPRRRSSLLRVAAGPLVHHVEDLGLFLRGALPTDPPLEPDVVRAVERMAQDGVEPPPFVLHALRVHADEIAARLVRGCSPAQLCVLLDTLRALSTRPTTMHKPLAPLTAAAQPTTTLDGAIAATEGVPAPEESHYTHLRARVEAAVRDAADARLSSEDENDVMLALHGDAATLRAGILPELTAAYHCERVAHLLLAMPPLATALPLVCVQQLRALATPACAGWGRSLAALAANAAHELASPAALTALTTAFTRDGAETTIHELMLEMGRAATASLSGDVLALWTALHTAAAACGRQHDFGFRSTDATAVVGVEIAPDIAEIEVEVDMDENVAQKLRRKQEDARQFAMNVQRLLQSSPLLTFSRQTLDELALAAAERGVALSREALAELASHWDGLLQAMPLDAVRRTAEQLQRLTLDQSAEAQEQWRTLLERTQRVAADSARAAELLSTQVVDFYTVMRPQAQSVMAALETKAAEHLREVHALGDDWAKPGLALVESAYDEAARGARKKVVDAARQTKSTLATLKSKLPSLSKLEIVRDFAQVISMVFTNLYTVALERAPETVGRLQRNVNRVQAWLRGIANFAAADFTAVLIRYSGTHFEDVFFGGFMVAIAVGCLCLFVLVTAVAIRMDKHDPASSQPVEKLSGKERVVAWFSAQLTITRVTILLTVCQSVHLPIARLCVEILTGTRATSSVHRRYRDTIVWDHLYIAAWILLFVYVVGLIVLLVVLIYLNAPEAKPEPAERQPTWRGWLRQKWLRATKSKHLTIVDLDGTRVNFRNSVYAAILARDPVQLRCPYRSLYAGFERRWRYYKVVQLTMKLVLTMLLIWIRDPRVRALTTLGVTALSFVSTWTAPFIDDFDDTLELCAKGTAVVTCVGGVVLVYYPLRDTEATQVVATTVTIVNVLNGVLMVAITCFGSDSVKASLKSLRGTLLFSDSKRYAVDKPADKVLPEWDIAYEIRHRVWHPFWKRTLLSLGEHEAIQRLAHGKVEEERIAAIAARQAKGKDRRQSAAEAAVLAQQRHWVGQADECVASVRVVVRNVLEGPDVFYQVETRSGFGRLTVVDYPFHCEFQFDDEEEEDTANKFVIVEDCDIAALLFLNFRPDVAQRRGVRQKLRALSVWAQPLELPLERDEPWAERDDALPTKASATCHCRYTNGVVSVRPDEGGGDMESSRFRLSIKYDDGIGEVTCPETGQVLHCVINRSAVVKGDAALALLGLTHTFDEIGTTFQEILDRPDVGNALETHLSRVEASQRDARERKIKQQHDRDAVLGRGFRYMVYNNPRISRRDLEKYLAEDETNPRLQKIAVTRRAALDVLYEKLHYLHADPRVGYWYVFWHDVYEQNADEMAQVRANKRHLDPEEPMSIAYDVLPKEKLQKWLERRGLWGERRFLGVRWRKALFHKELLDLLYQSMEKQVTPHAPRQYGEPKH